MATTIQGLDRLKKKLRAMPNLARQEIAKAMETSAQEVVDLARSLVPVASGDLRDSIGWTWGAAPKGSIALGTVRNEGRGAGNMAITIFAGNDRAFYARWVEFGARGQPAQPFFFPAYRAIRKWVRSRVSRAITKAARAAAAA